MSESRKRYSSALDHFSQSKLDEAVQMMEQIMSDDPAFLDVYEGLAACYARKGDLDRAITTLECLLAKDPANIMAVANLSVFYMKKGMKDKAEELKARATVLRFQKPDRADGKD